MPLCQSKIYMKIQVRKSNTDFQIVSTLIKEISKLSCNTFQVQFSLIYVYRELILSHVNIFVQDNLAT